MDALRDARDDDDWDDDDWPGFSLTPDEIWAALRFLEAEWLKEGAGEIPPGFRKAATDIELHGQTFL